MAAALLFVVVFLAGFFAIGPMQWGNIPLPSDLFVVYKVLTPLVLLAASILVYRSERFRRYWILPFAFFVGATAFLLAWWVAQFVTYPSDTISGIALGKARDALLVVLAIVVLTFLVGGNRASIFFQKGNLKLGLLIGLGTFVAFALLAIPGASLLFFGQGLTVERILPWTPWILIFALASGTMEESLYRGLFLRKYHQFFGKRTANLLQALVFTTIHIGVVFTPEPLLFLLLVFLLGLAWGYTMQKTDSVIGSILFHAGTDIVLIAGLFSAL
ncbi:MAG: CPBP family intramembrane metalloprotease [Candidatus Thermoplasmatota archaeon]|nr:CPBP family intramembrane metalloprotease [Candidatus Thermoplasmatota archaeon]